MEESSSMAKLPQLRLSPPNQPIVGQWRLDETSPPTCGFTISRMNLQDDGTFSIELQQPPGQKRWGQFTFTNGTLTLLEYDGDCTTLEARLESRHGRLRLKQRLHGMNVNASFVKDN
jgi:hypothetical protein